MTDKQLGWVYEQDGWHVYRASSLGGCITSLVAARLGEAAFPPGSALRAAMDASSAFEEEALEAYQRATGHTVIWQQKEVELVIGADSKPLAVVRGHIDGLDQQDDCIVEVKSFGPTYWDAYNGGGGLDGLVMGLKYAWQGAAYGHATGRHVRFVIYKKHATDEEREENMDIIIEPAINPELLVPLEVIQERVIEVEQYAADDVMPECDRNCRPGDAYDHVHIFESPITGDDDLLKAVERDRELDAQILELQYEKDELRDKIKAAYTPGKYTVGRYTMTLAKKSRTRFDRKAFKKAHPDLDEAFTVPGPTFIEMRITD